MLDDFPMLLRGMVFRYGVLRLQNFKKHWPDISSLASIWKFIFSCWTLLALTLNQSYNADIQRKRKKINAFSVNKHGILRSIRISICFPSTSIFRDNRAKVDFNVVLGANQSKANLKSGSQWSWPFPRMYYVTKNVPIGEIK